MITAEDARRLANSVWAPQSEQIERAIKEAIIRGETSIYYNTALLREDTIDWLNILGYKVQTYNEYMTEISWEA